jgi:superfamily II DNA/RNA helicase
MLSLLSDRIWKNPDFHASLAAITQAWLQKELKLPQTVELSASQILRCVQAATILSASEDPPKQRAAYSIAACAYDLGVYDFPGLAGSLRVVLSRLGNFPALSTAKDVYDFSRLPTRVALSEAHRSQANEILLDGKTLVLTDFQRKLWEHLIQRRNIAISAPTSAGKSFVLQAYLRHLAREQSIVQACYIVPSRALIAQVTDTITEWRVEDQLGNLSVLNVPLTREMELPRPAIFVLTQERLQALMGAHPKFSPETIICDEAQTVQEGSRGVLLQNVIDDLLSRNPKAQLIFAGPNIRNLSVFADLFGLKQLDELQSRSPSVVQNLVVVNTRSVIKGKLIVERFSPFERADVGTTNIDRALPSVKERLVRVSERFGKSRPSIVYANRPSDAEGVALGLAQAFKDNEPTERLKTLSAFVKEAVHEKYDLAACLLKGVGFHYGRIPALVRRSVEEAFADGEIRYLVTTSTLIQGVNFPAANLFVCKPKKGSTKQLDDADFWNLAGRAGRLGKEFQGNIFLIDYDEWETKHADNGNEFDIQPFLAKALSSDFKGIVDCARNPDPPFETDKLTDVEAAFARLFSDQIQGRLSQTLARSGVSEANGATLKEALEKAQKHITLPYSIIAMSPTVSAFRQQRLYDYLFSEVKGGGIARLEKLIPRHPRDPEAYNALSEVYRICHEHLLTLNAPRLHMRFAAISLQWMKGSPLPDIINENYKYNSDKLFASCIRSTLSDIEQELRFKYLRLTTCYIAILGHALKALGHEEYLNSLSPLPTYLEVGASDQSMISFMSLGLSRLTARLLARDNIDKDMSPAAALKWLRELNIDSLEVSPIVRSDIIRALANAST